MLTDHIRATADQVTNDKVICDVLPDLLIWDG